MISGLRQAIRGFAGRAIRLMALALAFVCCFVFSACSLQSSGSDGVLSEVSPSPSDAPDPYGSGADNGAPPETRLIFVTERESVSGIEVRYPATDAEGAGRLNAGVRRAAFGFAESYADAGMTGVIDFVIKYNDRGLLSLLFTLYGEGGEPEDILTASFITSSGEPMPISECFGSCDGSYVFSLSDIVTRKAESMGLELISYLPPVDDGRLYYFDGEGMTLIYHRYEICAAEAGMPEVFLSFAELERYMGADSPLRRVQFFDGQEG